MRAMAHAAAVVRRPMPRGIVAIAAAVVVAGAGIAGRPALAVVVLAVQLGAVAGVLLLADAPAFGESLLLAGSAALVADLVSLRDRGAHVGWLVAVIAVALVAAVLLELVRRDRERVVVSLSATVSAVVVAVLVAHLLVVAGPRHGGETVAAALSCTAIALGVGRLTDLAVPRPVAAPGGSRGGVGLVAAVAIGAVAGAAFGVALDPLTPAGGALLGVAAGAAAAAAELASDLASADFDARPAVAAPLAAVLPIVLTAPVVYGVSRLLIG